MVSQAFKVVCSNDVLGDVIDVVELADCYRSDGWGGRIGSDFQHILVCETLSGDPITADQIDEINKVDGISYVEPNSDFDLDNVCQFANRVDKLGTFRTNLQQYLSSKVRALYY